MINIKKHTVCSILLNILIQLNLNMQLIMIKSINQTHSVDFIYKRLSLDTNTDWLVGAVGTTRQTSLHLCTCTRSCIGHYGEGARASATVCSWNERKAIQSAPKKKLKIKLRLFSIQQLTKSSKHSRETNCSFWKKMSLSVTQLNMYFKVVLSPVTHLDCIFNTGYKKN